MASDLLSKLGLDPAAREVSEALEDAEALADLITGLVAIRKRLQIRQSDLAEMLETTQSAVSDFERIGGNPRFSTIQKYARALGTRLEISLDGYALAEAGAAVEKIDVVLAPL